MKKVLFRRDIDVIQTSNSIFQICTNLWHFALFHILQMIDLQPIPKRVIYCHDMYVRYPKEIMKMERHFSALQRCLQKKNK